MLVFLSLVCSLLLNSAFGVLNVLLCLILCLYVSFGSFVQFLLSYFAYTCVILLRFGGILREFGEVAKVFRVS
ncbi:hypothetical protein [Helicobacter trogontum]|uniref:hypothetical protein n=1 Tax=Helicobacter trogontum TaxID=50960 RepID=UPI002A92051B|nr:hypothetical protein [Helicobacter trogontum]MDY5185054.1 hypothetical protein [Helicobacter trogontum]